MLLQEQTGRCDVTQGKETCDAIMCRSDTKKGMQIKDEC